MDVKRKANRRAPVAGELTDEERAAVLEVARSVGSTAARGPTAGQPSITAFLRDIAAGVVVLRRRKQSTRARQTAAAKIKELKRAQPGLTAPQVAAIVGCAESTVYAAWGDHREDTGDSDARPE